VLLFLFSAMGKYALMFYDGILVLHGWGARVVFVSVCVKRGRAEVRMPTNRTNGSHFD